MVDLQEGLETEQPQFRPARDFVVWMESLGLRAASWREATAEVEGGLIRRLPKDIVGLDGMTLIVWRPPDKDWCFAGYDCQHRSIGSARRRRIEQALDWVEREIRMASASDQKAKVILTQHLDPGPRRLSTEPEQDDTPLLYKTPIRLTALAADLLDVAETDDSHTLRQMTERLAQAFPERKAFLFRWRDGWMVVSPLDARWAYPARRQVRLCEALVWPREVMSFTDWIAKGTPLIGFSQEFARGEGWWRRGGLIRDDDLSLVAPAQASQPKRRPTQGARRRKAA